MEPDGGRQGTMRARGSRLRQLHQAVRFAFPQRNAIALILGLTLFVAAVNAVEPLVLKQLFDELAGDMRFRPLILGLAALAGLAVAPSAQQVNERPEQSGVV